MLHSRLILPSRRLYCIGDGPDVRWTVADPAIDSVPQGSSAFESGPHQPGAFRRGSELTDRSAEQLRV
jgi:hypothetical protein